MCTAHSSGFSSASVRSASPSNRLRSRVASTSRCTASPQPRDPETLPRLVKESVEDWTLTFQGVATALSEDGPTWRHPVRSARSAARGRGHPVAESPASPFGSTWQMLDDRLGLRVSPVSLQGMRWVDLRKYNVIVIPDAWDRRDSVATLDDGARRRLRTWVEAGGTLIALGDSAAFVAARIGT